jgi:hypothetical protein
MVGALRERLWHACKIIQVLGLLIKAMGNKDRLTCSNQITPTRSNDHDCQIKILWYNSL